MNQAVSIYTKFWRYLIDSPGNESMEHRILNAVFVLSFLGLAICAGINYSIGLTHVGLVLSGFLILQAIVYYMSRYQKKFGLSCVLYAIASYLFLICNYFYNDGLNGPTLLVFFVSLHFLLSITPERFSWIWIPIHVCVVAALLMFEYINPTSINHSYTSVSSRFIDFNCTFIILVVITYFITHSIRKRFNEERKKVAEQNTTIEQKNILLEHIDHERNRLFSIIAHDLRSPLASINGYLQLLTLEDGLSPEERVEMERHLYNLSTNTIDMVNNLLAWSKGQLDGKAVELRPLNILETLSTTIEIQRAVAQRKQIVIDADIPSGLLYIADKDCMDLVVRNLLSNAIKFTHEGGRIEISAIPAAYFIELHIRDNGQGIAEDQKSSIFKAQIRPTRGTADEKGIGMGLAMCKDFVELQGGSITFESEWQHGTSFRLTLPIFDSNKHLLQ